MGFISDGGFDRGTADATTCGAGTETVGVACRKAVVVVITFVAVDDGCVIDAFTICVVGVPTVANGADDIDCTALSCCPS